MIVHRLQGASVEVAARQARLVGDQHQPKSSMLKQPQPLADTIVQLQLIRARWIVAWVDECAIAIKEECPLLHRICLLPWHIFTWKSRSLTHVLCYLGILLSKALNAH